MNKIMVSQSTYDKFLSAGMRASRMAVYPTFDPILAALQQDLNIRTWSKSWGATVFKQANVGASLPAGFFYKINHNCTDAFLKNYHYAK